MGHLQRSMGSATEPISFERRPHLVALPPGAGDVQQSDSLEINQDAADGNEIVVSDARGRAKRATPDVIWESINSWLLIILCP